MIPGLTALDWVVAGAAAVSLYVLASWYLGLADPPEAAAEE